jgi:hypothetical protein
LLDRANALIFAAGSTLLSGTCTQPHAGFAARVQGGSLAWKEHQTTMRGLTPLAAFALCIAAGCASGRLPDARGLDVIVKARPSAVAADASGARTIAMTTQCDAEFVRVLASGAFLVRLWPTQRAPEVQKCLSQLKALPGVEYAQPDAAMKAS